VTNDLQEERTYENGSYITLDTLRFAPLKFKKELRGKWRGTVAGRENEGFGMA
jgi:hypothetical protein